MDDGDHEVDSSGTGLLDFHNDPYSPFVDDSSVILSDWWYVSIGSPICSHKHICNPTTGPDNTHTHTCEHTHTQTIGSGDGDGDEDDEKITKKRRPAGNKAAVRKYREKQKAVKVNLESRNAELEKENQRIPLLVKENVRLRRKLQELGPRQDAVESLLTENKKLKGLLSSFRRAIDSEFDGLEDLGHQNLILSPSGKPNRAGDSPSGARCASPVPCFPPSLHHHHQNGGMTELKREGRLSWHGECETRTVAAGSDAAVQVKDAHRDTKQQCNNLDDVNPPRRDSCTAASASKEVVEFQRRTKGPAAGMTSTLKPQQNLLSGHGDSASTGRDLFDDHTDGVACSSVTAPLPCFSTGPRAATLGDTSMHCHNDCDGGVTTDKSSCPVLSTAINPPRKPWQNASSQISEQSLCYASSSKNVDTYVTGGVSPVDLFPPAGVYSHDGTLESPVAATTCWGHHGVSPVVGDNWLEECGFIGGVCQAHLDSAMETACDGQDDISSLATVVVNTVPMAV